MEHHSTPSSFLMFERGRDKAVGKEPLIIFAQIAEKPFLSQKSHQNENPGYLHKIRKVPKQY